MQKNDYIFKKLCLYLLIIVLYIHLSLEIELSRRTKVHFKKTFSKEITHRAQISLRLFSISQGDQLIMTLSSVKNSISEIIPVGKVSPGATQ